MNADVKFSSVNSSENITQYLNSVTATNKIDLILMDVNMEAVDGISVLKELRSQKKFSSIPIAVFTRSRSEEQRMVCLESKANTFVKKPENPEDWPVVTRYICILYLKGSLPD